jgi:uncharacterized glyoxalase superfamily protein PhnB
MATKAAGKKATQQKTARASLTKKPAAKRSAATPARAAKPVSKKLSFTSLAPGLTVDDIAKSLAWYCDLLGFEVKQRWEHNGVLLGAELAAGDVTVYLGQDDWKKGRDRIKGQGLRVYWYTNQNIDQLAAGIKSRGGTLASEPKDEWGARSFNLVDPTGYNITVSSEG